MQYTTYRVVGTEGGRLFISISKYKFECNTQLTLYIRCHWVYCLSVYQSTNLNAIHNGKWHQCVMSAIVYQYIKVQIWMQYTTICSLVIRYIILFISISKYKFECNTQRYHLHFGHLVNCLSVYQSTNLNAIHNDECTDGYSARIVYQYIKVQIWMQYTTRLSAYNERPALFISISKYKFECNTQRQLQRAAQRTHCLSVYQSTNLNAIHNLACVEQAYESIVYQYIKVQIWMQYTTPARYRRGWYWLFISISKYKFECNTQLVDGCFRRLAYCLSVYQSTNLNAIHNPEYRWHKRRNIVYQYIKVQIWMQYTTSCMRKGRPSWLFISISKYKFECNTQQLHTVEDGYLIVYQYVKVQIWMQYTTVFGTNASRLRLFISMSKYKFECNTQRYF